MHSLASPPGTRLASRTSSSRVPRLSLRNSVSCGHTRFVRGSSKASQDIYAYLHHNHLDTPQQATDKQGNIVWAAHCIEGNPLLLNPTGEMPWWAVVSGAAGGAMNVYQQALCLCSSKGDVAWAFAGGFVSAFVGTLIPSTQIRLGRAIIYGTAGAYGGSQANNVIINRSFAGVSANHSNAMTSSYMGGFVGAVGNYAGLGTALANVRSGSPVSDALRTADRIGDASTVLIGVADNAAQFSTPYIDPCICKK